MSLSTNRSRIVNPRFSKSAIFLLSSLFAFGTVSCSQGDGDPPQADGGDAGEGGADAHTAIARLEVTPAEAWVKEGRTVQLEAKAFDASDVEIANIDITWKSSDEKIATVDVHGLVWSLRPGEVVITASASGKAALATITVTESTAARVELGAKTRDIPLDDEVTLHAVVRDADGFELFGREITWTSEDESIATVSEIGTVFGVDLGETKITAKLGALEASVDARVVLRFAKLFAGASHSCGLTALGRAFCWGDNGHGQLGAGDEASDRGAVPHRLAVDPSVSFKTLALGVSFGCGLTKSEKVYCWGSNEDFVLGRKDMARSSSPLLLDDRSYKAISAMGHGVCGLDDGGFAHCWGKNSADFELGNPTITESSASPVAVSAPVEETKPIAFTELRHGERSSCGLTSAGKLYCWGFNKDFRLGDGSEESRARPVAPVFSQTVDPNLDQAVIRFDLGRGFGCATTEEWGFRTLESAPPPPNPKTTHCWGENRSGQALFGNSSFAIETPKIRFRTSDFIPASLALGDSHACALDDGGRALCWGSNAHSQLGRPTALDTADIGLVDIDLRFRQLVSGGSHVCGLAMDGKSYCWGKNDSGQLGKGDVESGKKPMAVVGQ